MPVNKISVHLDRLRKVYHQGESITGHVLIENKYDLKHEGIVVSVEGAVDLNFNLRSISFMDTFYGSKVSFELLNQTHEILGSGRLAPGHLKLPFRLPLEGLNERSILYETYHGVFISIQYRVKCQVKRPFLSKDIVEFLEFIIEYDPEPIGAPSPLRNPIEFTLTPEILNSARNDLVPDFRIVGKLDSTICNLAEPLTGEFTVERCDAIIRSVELQLVRIETCGSSPGDRDYSHDVTEVQNIQIGDGNLLRNISVPIYAVFPRLFTCPTLKTWNFKIEFGINLVVIFDDNYLITENFPIKLIRSTLQPID